MNVIQAISGTLCLEAFDVVLCRNVFSNAALQKPVEQLKAIDLPLWTVLQRSHPRLLPSEVREAIKRWV